MVLINIGLLVGVWKHCNIPLKVWLVKAFAMCVLGVYQTILNTFGTYTPLYGVGVLNFLAVDLYVLTMILVWIFHERGNELLNETAFSQF